MMFSSRNAPNWTSFPDTFPFTRTGTHFAWKRYPLVTRDTHRDAHATADAERGETLLGVALLHFVQQRHQHAGAGSADGMADRDRPAIDVALAGVPAEILVDGTSLRRKGLVSLDQIEVADIPAGLLQCGAGSRDRARTHDLGIDAGLSPGDDASQRLLAFLGGLLGRHQHHGGSAVIDAGGGARGDRAFLLEGGLQLGHRIERGAMTRIFVGVDDDVALAGLDGDRDDLVLELAGLLRGLGLLLRLDRELVLLGAGDLPLPRDVLGGVAHVVAVEGIPQAVLDHGVDQLEAAHLDAAAQILRVRGHAHGFLAAGHHDVRIAVKQRLITQRHGAQTGTAKLVDAPGRALHRNAGRDRGLAGRVLALRRGQDLTHDDFGDPCGLDSAALERGLDGDGTEVVGRGGRECAVEAANRGAGGADDDDIV